MICIPTLVVNTQNLQGRGISRRVSRGRHRFATLYPRDALSLRVELYPHLCQCLQRKGLYLNLRPAFPSPLPMLAAQRLIPKPTSSIPLPLDGGGKMWRKLSPPREGQGEGGRTSPRGGLSLTPALSHLERGEKPSPGTTASNADAHRSRSVSSLEAAWHSRMGCCFAQTYHGPQLS
jgi:hypothetical protein